MAKNLLSREDWQRILWALSHFLHNPDFQDTHNRVRSNFLDPDSPDGQVG